MNKNDLIQYIMLALICAFAEGNTWLGKLMLFLISSFCAIQAYDMWERSKKNPPQPTNEKGQR